MFGTESVRDGALTLQTSEDSERKRDDIKPGSYYRNESHVLFRANNNLIKAACLQFDSDFSKYKDFCGAELILFL